MKKLLFATAIMILSTGCSAIHSPKTAVMDQYDLTHYRGGDCNYKRENLAFLNRQLNNVPFWDKVSQAAIQYNIRFISSSCGDPAPRPSQCVNVRESFQSGNSNVTVCRDEHFTQPIINRWQTEVDK